MQSAAAPAPPPWAPRPVALTWPARPLSSRQPCPPRTRRVGDLAVGPVEAKPLGEPERALAELGRGRRASQSRPRRLDRPGVAGMQERREIRLLLLAGGAELVRHQVVVDGRFDI